MGEPSARVSLAQLRAVADLAELPIDDDRLRLLLPQVESLIAGLDALDELDLDEVEPEIVFRAAWSATNG